MPTRTRLLAIAAIVFAAAAPSAAITAFLTYDLTGTWEGSLKCSELVGGVKQKTVFTPVMRIRQVGLNLGVQLDFGTSTNFYAGLANPDAKKPEQKGEAALILCGTDNVLGVDFSDEIARMAVSTKPQKVKATFKGVSIFSDPSAPAPAHGTCKWKWTRIDTNNPSLATDCGATMAGPPRAQIRGGLR